MILLFGTLALNSAVKSTHSHWSALVGRRNAQVPSNGEEVISFTIRIGPVKTTQF